MAIIINNKTKFTNEAFNDILIEIPNKFYNIINETDLSFTENKSICIPNWACSWNKPSDINKKCTWLGYDEKIVIVQFKNNYINFYRKEDLTIM